MDHPITPPLKLVEQWAEEAAVMDTPLQVRNYYATQAARWGADQELEACCEWLDDTGCDDPQEVAHLLRAARRPKPPSLKQQALEALERMHDTCLMTWDNDTIRRALEQLDD